MSAEIELRKRLQRNLKNVRDEQAEAVAEAADALALSTSPTDDYAQMHSKMLGLASELDVIARKMDRVLTDTFGQALPQT